MTGVHRTNFGIFKDLCMFQAPFSMTLHIFTGIIRPHTLLYCLNGSIYFHVGYL